MKKLPNSPEIDKELNRIDSLILSVQYKKYLSPKERKIAGILLLLSIVAIFSLAVAFMQFAVLGTDPLLTALSTVGMFYLGFLLYGVDSKIRTYFPEYVDKDLKKISESIKKILTIYLGTEIKTKLKRIDDKIVLSITGFSQNETREELIDLSNPDDFKIVTRILEISGQ